MNVVGLVAQASDFTEGYVDNAVVTMAHGFQCTWTKVFATGDCRVRDADGEFFPIDCNQLINTQTSIGCAPAGSINGVPDVDAFVADVKMGFGDGWCYRSLSGPCPQGVFVVFVGGFGCFGSSSPNATPGSVSI